MSKNDEAVTKEYYKGKEIIDVKPKEQEIKTEAVEPKVERPTHMFFTVSLAGAGGRPSHIIVKAESALQALVSVQEVKKAPVMGVHITEYSDYFDAEGYNKDKNTEKAIIM